TGSRAAGSRVAMPAARRSSSVVRVNSVSIAQLATFGATASSPSTASSVNKSNRTPPTMPVGRSVPNVDGSISGPPGSAPGSGAVVGGGAIVVVVVVVVVGNGT